MSAHFGADEFAQPARHGFPRVAYPAEWVNTRLAALCEVLEVIRAHLGKPVNILSGFRTIAYNKAVGGEKKSQHVEGRAADIHVPGVEPKAVQAAVQKLFNDGRLPALGGLGCYKTFTHIDVRPRKVARWNG